MNMQLAIKTTIGVGLALISSLTFMSTKSYSQTCTTACGTCGLYSGAEMDACFARRQQCLATCQNSQPITPGTFNQTSPQYQAVPKGPSYGASCSNLCYVPGKMYPVGSKCYCPGKGYGVIGPDLPRNIPFDGVILR